MRNLDAHHRSTPDIPSRSSDVWVVYPFCGFGCNLNATFLSGIRGFSRVYNLCTTLWIVPPTQSIEGVHSKSTVPQTIICVAAVSGKSS